MPQNVLNLIYQFSYIVLRKTARSGQIFVVGFGDINALITAQMVEKGRCNHYPPTEKVWWKGQRTVFTTAKIGDDFRGQNRLVVPIMRRTIRFVTTSKSGA